ncbi:MAG TPA: hypothetical protein PLV93_02220, partial [Microthrixaceae bacterium]|nr:hypothetical protein [Microthrixaceae bacterium]
MTGVRPPSTIRIFVRLKARLVVNGVRRMTRSTWARVGFAFAVLGAVGAAALGFGMALGLRSFWDPHEQHRILVLVTFGIVMGWWFGPILSGGVDETIDPARLSLLPLTRRQIRTGQIAAGFWVTISRFAAAALTPLFPSLEERFLRHESALWITGVFLFLLSTLLCYLLAEVESAREAREREIRSAIMAREAELKALRDQ